ncbi:MAG: hypothetical protein JSU01_16145 [Bacteroidetes bacterium]|nr:hypothetical protein [Bacteroidota bacterium]
MLKTPVLLLIYNRPDKTQQVFNAIKSAKPQKLFVVADGPKNAEGAILCKETRNVIAGVDWDCEVKTLYRKNNLGCKYNVSSGISWFFEQVEEGIILEDDCVPAESFFLFCSELLERYRNNERIMHITGVNLNDRPANSVFTYYFSNYPSVWGWATWRRAWQKYDLELNDTGYYRRLVVKRFKDPFEKRFWNTVLTTLNKIDTWDYQWMFSIWRAGGVCINTNYNLVSNIGFDGSATHTTYESQNSNLPKVNISQINHPDKIAIDEQAETEFLRSLHNLERRGYWNYFLMRSHNLIHKIKLLVGSKKKEKSY